MGLSRLLSSSVVSGRYTANSGASFLLLCTLTACSSRPDIENWDALHECTDAELEDVSHPRAESLDWPGINFEFSVSHNGGCEISTYGVCFVAQESDGILDVQLVPLRDSAFDSCNGRENSGVLSFAARPLRTAFPEFFSRSDGLANIQMGSLSKQYHTTSTSVLEVASWESIDQRVEMAGRCDTVADCQPLTTRPCQTEYVNPDNADLETLKDDIAARVRLEFPEESSCDADCACGYVTCSSGQCRTAVHTCDDEDLLTDQIPICL